MSRRAKTGLCRRPPGRCGALVLSLLLGLLSVPARAAITYVGVNTDTGNASASNITVPAGSTTGTFLIVQVTLDDDNGTSITAPSGWTLVRRDQITNTMSSAIYYKFRAAGDPSSYNFQFSNGRHYAVGILAYSGVNTSSPIDVHGGQTSNSSSTIYAPAVTTTQNNDQLIWFYSMGRGTNIDNFGGTPSAGTQRYSDNSGGGNNGVAILTADQQQASAGSTGTQSITYGYNHPNIGQTVALRQAIAAPTLQSAYVDCGSSTSVIVTFSKPVTAATAGVAANYSLNNGATVSAASLLNSADAYGTVVVLTVSSLTSQSYILTVNNVQGYSGNTIAANSQTTFYGQSGEYAAGITGTYYDQNGTAGAYFTGNTVVQNDAQINNNWGAGGPPALGVVDNFSVVWDGYVQAAGTGSYTFTTTSDDGVRLYVNGSLVINDWNDHAATNDTSASISLTAGQYYKVRMEYYEHAGSAVAQLAWNGTGTGGQQTIPAASIFHCTPPPAPVLQYNMDETGWNGTSGEVTDYSGNGYNGTAAGLAPPPPTTANTSPAIPGSPGTCGYGVFNRSNKDYVAIPSGFPNLGASASFTITAWIRTTNNTQSGQRIFIDDQDNTQGWGFSLGDGGTGSLRFFSRGTPSALILDTSNVITNNTWYFVVVEANISTKTKYIYVYNTSGTQIASVNATWTEASFGSDAGPASIGGETNAAGENSSSFGFAGNIDEVRAYSQVLTQSEIATVMQDTRPCANMGPDHFHVVHSAYGIYCLPEAVTVSARDASNNVLTSYGGTITISTSSGAGTWSLASGSGTLTNLGSGQASYTFAAADMGQATFDLHYSAGATPINIGATDGSALGDDPPNSLSFSPSGFTVTPAPLSNPPPATINTTIPTQTAGTPFPLYLTAYGQTPTDPVCGVIESYTGARSLNFWSTYNNPATGTVQVSVDGNAIATTEGASSAQSVTFTNGQASVTVNYEDVGLIQLAMKDITSNPSTTIQGGTNPFVVKPDHFVLSNIRRTSDNFANPGATNQNGTVFIKAGDPFSVTVTAKSSDGATTPNYGQESTPETVKLTSALVAPAGGNNPAIAFTTGFGSFTSGVATGTDFSWGEVGIITLTPSVGDGDYLGAGDVTGNASGNVGRFTPYDFNVVLNTSPAFAPACGTFTYLDQGFDYATTPQVTLTARNKAGTTTQNYDGVWWKLADFTETYTHNGTLPGSVTLDPAAAGHTAVNCSAGSCNGAFTTTFHGPFTYTRAGSPVAPFAGAVNISFPITDSDGVSYASNPFTINNIGFTGANNSQRWGRLTLANVTGSELLPLTMPVTTQYYNGTAFITNTADSCTAPTLAATIVLSNPATAAGSPQPGTAAMTVGAGASSITSGDPTISSGASAMTFSAPGPNNTGYIDVTTDLVGSGLRYLQSDTDGNGIYDNDPTARVTFGIYNGSSNLIYIREPW